MGLQTSMNSRKGLDLILDLSIHTYDDSCFQEIDLQQQSRYTSVHSKNEVQVPRYQLKMAGLLLVSIILACQDYEKH